MEYELIYHPAVLKSDLAKIPQNIKQTIKKAIEGRLLYEPILAGKPLQHSLKGYRKLRVGDYRIIYKIQGKLIIILKIGHRREVYAQVFPRLNYRSAEN